MKRWWKKDNEEQSAVQTIPASKMIKKKWWIIGISTVTAAAVAGTGIYVLGKKNTVRADSDSTVQETTAQTGTVENTITGSGTLQTGTGSSVKVPSGLTYTEVCVKSGDTVQQGDVLAYVDHNSVLSAKSSVQEQIDAIDEQTFTGTVTSVSSTASSSGNGSAKYTVEISIPKDSLMKAGMSASATIVVESSENVETIPVNALQEKGGSSYVYTSVDADGNLSGETEVETGLSDGDTVEITDGLSDGDTVYYEKTGNTSSSSGQQGGMGEAPSGDNGNMPSGDMPSGQVPSGGNGGEMPSGGNGGGPGGQ